MDFVGFLVILGTHSESFFGHFSTKKKSYLFPGCFFCWFLGLNFGVWDWKNMHLAWKVLQKSTFAEIVFLMIPDRNFHDFLLTLGPIFLIFDALETGLKFDDFSR